MARGLNLHMAGLAEAAKAFFRMEKRLPTLWNEAMANEAYRWSRTMKLMIRNQRKDWPPLSKITKFWRTNAYFLGVQGFGRSKSSKKLLFSGGLLRAIRATKIKKGVWFAGVNKHEVSPTGKRYADIAISHELGYSTTVARKLTRKQIGIFARLVKQGLLSGFPKGHMYRPRIPARPFAKPTYEIMIKGMAERIRDDIKGELLTVVRKG